MTTPANGHVATKEALVSVNGVSVPFREGQRVLGALREAGFDVPTLCYESRLDPQGTCRMCLVEVEVNGQKKTVASCTAFQQPGMNVATHTQALREYRRTVLELLLSETAPAAQCPKCHAFGPCQLHAAAQEYGALADGFPHLRVREKAADSNPFIQRDYDYCIACYRCTSVCNQWEMAGAITVAGSSQSSRIATFFGNELLQSPCTFCGQCINTCPTDALTDRKLVDRAHAEKLNRTKTICPYCGVGCGIQLLSEDGELIGSEPDFDAPSRGSLCVKGQFGSWEFVRSEERLKYPLIRRNGVLQRAMWDEAINLVASRFQETAAVHGPDSLVFWSSARCTTESNYLMQKLARVGLGTNNIDNCSRT